VVSFEIHGGREQAWQVVDATRMLSITANLGDAKSTITHPASTTHGRLTQGERDRAGIRESLIRVSAGLEEITDIQADLQRGLSLIG
jgi:O-succinylhomoserine sulfhydrylase